MLSKNPITNFMKGARDRIFCPHGHTVEQHPKCFAEGKVIDKRKDKTIPWYKVEGLKIGFFDIETDGLKADFATMLSWCVKDLDGEINYGYITRAELLGGSTDELLIQGVVAELSRYNILVGFYSKRFDMPFIRVKALHYGIEFPNYGSIYHFDLYDHVRRNFNLSSRSLANTCDYLGIEGKTEIDKNTWRKAKYGDQNAVREVLEHNKGDVIITEKLYKKLIPYAKWTKSSI